MKRKELQRLLKMLDACRPARTWVSRTQVAPAELWKKCTNGSWMLWLAREARTLDRWVTANLVCRGFVPLALEYAGYASWAKLLRMTPKIADAEAAEKAAELCRQAYAGTRNKNGLVGTWAYAHSACDYGVWAGMRAADATERTKFGFSSYHNYENSYHTLWRVEYTADDAGISERIVNRRLCAVIRKHIPWAAVEKGLRGILR